MTISETGWEHFLKQKDLKGMLKKRAVEILTEDQCRVAYDYRERPYLIILISLELWFAKFSVSFSGDRHATCYCFSFNKHASNCRQKLSFRQFESACHRCNYTIVEGGNLRMNLTLSLTKILKIVGEK